MDGPSRLSPVPREARAYQGNRAGIVSRGLAAALDSVLVVLALVLGYLGWAGARFLAAPRRFTFPEASLLLSVGSLLALLTVYLALAWALSGRSYGALVMGLRVVDRHGHRLRLGVAVVRAAVSVLVPLGLLWVAASRRNLSLADLLLRTAVVYDWRPGGGSSYDAHWTGTTPTGPPTRPTAAETP
jgi:uncharacterized RDD family membrane protein YckC